MLRCFKGMAIPTVQQTLDVLNGNLDIRPIYIDYDKCLMNIYSLCNIIDKEAVKFGKISGEGDCSKNALLYYLQGHNLLNKFPLTQTGKISLSADAVDIVLAMDDITEQDREVLSSFRTWTKAVKARADLVPFLQNPISKEISCDGHRMLEIRPTWTPQNTGRVAMSKPAIQNMNRDLQELLTCPQGYKLLHTDSGQVEPRIVYSAFVPDPQIKALINLYNDAYFGVLHYCTMPEEEIRSGRTDFTKMEITEEMKAGRKKIKTYGNAVMYGSKREEDEIKAAMIKRIGQHPARLELIRRIENSLDRGNTIFKTYFGTPIDISNSKKLVGNGYNQREEMIKLAINNPIQGTAADLMRYSVMQANRIIMTQRKSSIVCYIHDAGVFYVHEDEYDNIHDELADIVSYQVDDWIPVYAESEDYEFNPNGAFAKYKY